MNVGITAAPERGECVCACAPLQVTKETADDWRRCCLVAQAGGAKQLYVSNVAHTVGN